mmetsp:Transcript_15979/g.36998  ORF Transcript_15979/g.36998 Transcript_15979/m.36998 type:complete len:540 (+) Transcript_15979:73-1692(+)
MAMAKQALDVVPSTAEAQSAGLIAAAVLKIAAVSIVDSSELSIKSIPDEGSDERSNRQSDEERVLFELANIVNSRAYRSRGPSRNLSVTLAPGIIPNVAADAADDESRMNSGIDKVSLLAHTETHLDPNSDLIDISPLGEGAFATVVLCKTSKRDAFPLHSHAAKSGLVAAKRLKPECVAEEPLEFDSFLSEAALVKTLVHKNVIECYGCIEYRDRRDGTHCAMILLEYLQGGSLRARIAKRDYDGAQALRWLIEIAEGMTYLHTVADIGIAHRDLKPDNILLNEHGVAKIADMGMARIAMHTPGGSPAVVALDQNYQSATAGSPETNLRDGGSRVKRSSSFSVTCRTGTPRYMAPENWAGESYTYKVDVFSYGILAYEVLSGKRAYGELMMNGQALADAVAEQGLRPTIPGSWPGALVALLRACWSTDPNERPDFTHVASELLRIEVLSKDNPALISKFVGGHHIADAPRSAPQAPRKPPPPRSANPPRSPKTRTSAGTRRASPGASGVSPGTKADKSKAARGAKRKQKPKSSMCVIS